MNERILKNLEDRCWYQEPCDFDMNVDGLSTVHTRFDRRKFAQLIIQECSRVIKNGGYFNSAFGEKRQATPLEIAYMIEDYFGVNQ